MAYKVLHLSSHDNGGAGRAAYGLHCNFKRSGHESCLVVQYKTRDEKDVIQAIPGLMHRIVNRLGRQFSRTRKAEFLKDYYFFNAEERATYFPTGDLLRLVPFKPDIIVAHWISGFINSRNLYELGKLTGATVCWYFLDAAPFTGGCHYFWECRHFLTHCRKCPAIRSDTEKDLAYLNFEHKLKFIQKSNIVPVAATNEYLRLIKESALFNGKRSKLIPLGIDELVFAPVDRKVLRRQMQLQVEMKIVLIAAGDLSEKRKGIALALQSLEILFSRLSDVDQKRIHVLVAGVATDELVSRIRFSYTALGYFREEKDLAGMYQVSDVYLCSSIEDAGPMMAMEAMMCGVPVVGFDMGVMPDLVKGNTGRRVDKGDVQALARSLHEVLFKTEDESHEMALACRQHALSMFDPRLQVERILDLHRENQL